jgi:hypothetical protein
MRNDRRWKGRTMLIMKTFGLILSFFVTSKGAADVRDKLRRREAVKVKRCILSAYIRQSIGANLESLHRVIGSYGNEGWRRRNQREQNWEKS